MVVLSCWAPCRRYGVRVSVVTWYSSAVGAEHRPVLRLDDGEHAIRLGARSAHADLAQHAFGQVLVARDLGPGVSAVGRLEQAAAGPTAGQAPRRPTGLPERRVQHAW